MKFNYRFKDLLGVSYSNGNVIFDDETGNMLLSGVGNRVRLFDLVNNAAETLPFELRRNVRCMCLSHDNRLLVVVDTEGRGLLVNFASRKVLHRFNMKGKVRVMAFSPDNKHLAVAVGRHVQVWAAPGGVQKEFSPLVLHRTYTGHHDAVISLSWSPSGRYLVTGSKDMSARVYSLVTEKDFVVVTLTGHKERVVGCFFAEDELIYTLSKDGALIVWRWEWAPLAESNGSDDEAASDGDEEEDKVANGGGKLAKDDAGESDPPLSIKLGEWQREARHFIQRDHARVHCAVLQRSKGLLVVGFDNGVFSLFEMPDATHLQSLSVSQHELRSAAVNSTGEWLALASAQLGQVLVWEWQSETYVLKQQGHFYDLNVAAYSPDGQLVATGGDDAKVKLWSTTSGFCFVTFSEHEAPVTALSFVGDAGNAVVSASLDGSVRAFDLVRYRNFRTMVTPTPTQLTCLAVDGQGEIVCAGAMDPPDIYVWSLQTGRLLDVLSGHEGPVSALAFSPSKPLIASTSWDRTLRFWEPYSGTAPTETKEVGSNGLCVAFRPDGKEVCVGALSGQLLFWDVESGYQKTSIAGAKDISGGRRAHDRTTSKNATHNKHFSSVCYTADGSCIIAGGRSKFVCIYQVEQRVLLKKYQLSHNRSLDGILDKLDSRKLTEAGNSDTLDLSDASDSEGEDMAARAKALPGASRGDLGKRITKPEIRCKCVQFSPNGQEWAAATTEGLMIYALDNAMLFDPFQLEEDVTPDRVREVALKGDHGRAFTMALHLGEDDLITELYRAIPTESLDLVARGLPVVYVSRVLALIAHEISSTPNLQHHLAWARALLTVHQDRLRDQSKLFMSSFRALQKAITSQNKDLAKLCDENMYTLSFLSSAKRQHSSAALFSLVPAQEDDADAKKRPKHG
ncbi:Guanine nucleotide-binding protein subunit beta-1 [Hondaea fermentalgiana]|uniref:Guanine nucleotide-binding protein subunit beta-1 n=1 Tax=Hondaea fermentalgiana TaxID=2315210 RepID=A0A2R5GPN5_9STRA|nr:Guanine nucleotide-binding protein subunit beta-1 [Hondaea fermentalgiana]|eukprot:GBG30583.1 Guanine nucleotide-binding protein subunit beta-1 [Hondaea fermentalgiana]